MSRVTYEDVISAAKKAKLSPEVLMSRAFPPPLEDADSYLTTHDLSRLFKVDPSTIGKWMEKSWLKGFRTPGQHRRFRRSEVLAFCEEFAQPVPEELRASR